MSATNGSCCRVTGKTIAIVGGVAGGASAAARLRRNCEDVVINLYERGPYVSFANCGLPYYVGGIIQEQSKLFLTNPKNLKERYDINTFVNHEVVKIDPDAGTLVVRDTTTGEERTDSYDEIVLSPGAKPIVPPFPGRDLPGIFTIRNVPDTEHVKTWLKDHPNAKHVCVIGGGFIGIEMAENLRHLNYDVTMIDVADQVMTPMDREMVEWCDRVLRENGIKLHLSDGVAAFEKGEGGKLVVKTAKGTTIDTDMVVLSIGVRAESDLAKDAGLKLTPTGCIAVDDHMRTSHPKVYAVGDAVEKRNNILGTDMPFYMAGPANRQGRIVADVIAGQEHKFNGILGTGICGAFGLQVAMTGVSEKVLTRAGKVRGKDYDTVYLHPNDHVGYYPGAQQIHMKVVFTVPDGKVLGAQATGMNGADRRIDVISMAIQMGATVYDLAEAELCYAPQFGAAKDPVNLVGMYGVNVLKGYSTIAWWDSVESRKNDIFLLDCREKGEFANGSCGGAVNIPLSEIRTRLDEVPKDREVWVFCQSGVRAHTCQRMLLQQGYNVKNISGGYLSYAYMPPDSRPSAA